MKKFAAYQKTAFVIGILLILIFLSCMAWIIFPKPHSDGLTADIYQDGKLLQSISLSAVAEPYTFTVQGENGGTNTIEVRPGSIAVISADCPDKICVHQGFISTSLLPITCLPNHLVIQIRESATDKETATEPALDMISY